MKHSKHSARPMPQSLLDDPAFSTDPRAHPHFAMNSREEIVPADQSSYSDNSYRSRETSRGDPSFKRGLQATPGATYGHLPDHSEVIGGNSQNIRPTSEVSSYSYSSYPGSSQDPRASSGSIGLAYDDPHDDDAYNSSYASSSKSKLHTPKTPISSASAAFGPPTNLSQSPYAIFTPGGSPSSASSRSSSPLVPRTPSPHSGSPSTSTKKLKSSSSLHLHNPDEQEIEAPPAYTPLPTPVGLSFDIPTSAPAGASSSLLTPTPVPVPAPSTSADVLNTPTAFPTAPVRPPLATNTSAPELRPAPARDVPVRSATTPAKAPQPLPETIKMQRSRSRKTSISAPRDLDKIDELDETDPLGLAWHHESPYEAIQKAGVGRQSGPSGEPMRGVPKIFAAQNGVDPSQSQLENRKVCCLYFFYVPKPINWIVIAAIIV
ncbi:hypothetical protein EW026_g270 [Hermanssonia centrifuga]|uniref:Uncharacterized protein n=1 Tax=Hermanssonia centrifuga TaxID=98765 RepID=A0A4S4KV25_9APHY|nr:hypothetical protein EW026_g270 [Hermanssonia centrifuga]